MPLSTLGDLAQTLVTRQQNTALKSRLSQLTQELASGRSADLVRHLDGNLSWLGDIEHQSTVQSAYRSAAREAATIAGTMQTALGRIQAQAEDLGATAAMIGPATGPAGRDSAAEQARGALEAMIGALNTSVAGRPVFSGTDFSTPPLPSAGTVLDRARAALAGAATPGDVAGALDAFFGPGGDFETGLYQGGTQDVAAHRLGGGATVRLAVRADDPALRPALRNTVMAALADDPALALDDTGRDAVMRAAGEGLLTRGDALVRVQADLGHAESRIAQAESRIATELSTLGIARTTLIGIDPFEAAGALEDVQFQLETLYTITARSARLNLVNFLS